jgi:hypothetical protein
MADNAIKAPLGATHHHPGERGSAYYRFDGHVWKFWNVFRSEWTRCVDNKPVCNPTPLPPSEQSMCCGTTCDKRNVADYIVRLEAVAEAAQMVAHGPLAGDVRGDNLRAALAEVYRG